MKTLIFTAIYIALAATAANAKTKLSDVKVYTQSIPNEIDKAEAIDAAIEGKTIYKCSQQQADDLKAKLRNESGTATYTTGPIASKEKSKGKVRKAVRNGETWYLCNMQAYDEKADNLRNR